MVVRLYLFVFLSVASSFGVANIMHLVLCLFHHLPSIYMIKDPCKD